MGYHADDDGDIWDDETNTVYDSALIAGYLSHIQDICRTFVRLDGDAKHEGLTHRAWLAQSVLNILGGNIDAQIIAELSGLR